MHTTKNITSTERLDVSVSAKHSDYGSTTLKNRASPTNGQNISSQIHITTNEGALYSNVNDDSVQSVKHPCASSASVNANEVAYQSWPVPTTTYTSSLFAASTKRFQTRQLRYPRYAYSRMETYIDEKPTSKKSIWSSVAFQRFETFLFVLNQMCIGFVTIYMNWLCLTTGLQKTSLHAWLVTLGGGKLMYIGTIFRPPLSNLVWKQTGFGDVPSSVLFFVLVFGTKNNTEDGTSPKPVCFQGCLDKGGRKIVPIYINFAYLSITIVQYKYSCWEVVFCTHYAQTRACLIFESYSLLMAEAVLIHYNANPLTSHYKRHEKHTIHWVLQIMGGGLGMGGTLYKCIQKGFLLTSTHGKLGFATFILCLVSWLSGLTALYQLKLKSYVRPIFNRTFHNLIGFACFVLALITQYYGYKTGFFKARTNSETFRDCIKAVTLISLVLSSIGPIKALLQKGRTIFKV